MSDDSEDTLEVLIARQRRQVHHNKELNEGPLAGAAHAAIQVVRKRQRRINTVAGAALLVVAILAIYALWRQADPPPGPSQPLTITACPPETWINERCVNGPPSPEELVLTADAGIRVRGTVTLDGNEDVAYSKISVSWVHVDSGTEFEVISTPITYEAGRNEPYDITWVPPSQLLALIEENPPGTDLGFWRIVGRAQPVRTDLYAPYQWDSVRTFSLTTPLE